MAQLQTTAWKAPRQQPEILPATVRQAAEYIAWFVNVAFLSVISPFGVPST